MYEKIQAWLKENDRDFNKGLDHFQHASKNRSIFLYLSRKQNMSKLVYELEKLLKILPRETAKLKVVKDDASSDKEGNKNPVNPPAGKEVNTSLILPVDRAALPEDLQKVYDDISEAYKHQRAFHERMKLDELSDEQRAEARAEVVKLDDTIVAGWKLIDDFFAKSTKKAETKNEPAAPAPAVKTPLSFTKEVNAARTYISRNVGKVETAKGAVKDDLIKKLKERYATLVNLKAEVDPVTTDKLIKAGIIDKT